jgi:hypothetical protein
MTPDEQPVRLVVLGEGTGAPVCEGDACYPPESIVDAAVAALADESATTTSPG